MTYEDQPLTLFLTNPPSSSLCFSHTGFLVLPCSPSTDPPWAMNMLFLCLELFTQLAPSLHLVHLNFISSEQASLN